jgi:hypothetical protein
MTFSPAVVTQNPIGCYSGVDNDSAVSMTEVPLTEFNKSIIKYPGINDFRAEPRTTYFRIYSIRRIACRRWIRTRCRRPSERLGQFFDGETRRSSLTRRPATSRSLDCFQNE